LFGYKKGAFTGASEDTKGLIQSAENGILFLDEIHHLSKNVQARLMKALQTNEKNELSIRRLGDSGETKVKDVRLIFATNKNVKELREILLPDFYDRIVQHVIEIPPLRDTIEDRVEDWKKVWEGLKFKGNPKVPNESNLIKWIRGLPLYGNFRDLQKIAMYYNAFNSFDDETRKLINEKTAFQYAKNEFEKYHSSIVQLENEKYNFNIEQTTKEMIADYLFELQDWAVKKFKGRKSAIEHFKSKGDTITEKTFNNWKNKKL
jgi:transcriptional regulator with AAA-type ATPase domain